MAPADPRDDEAQRRTVREMRQVGAAWLGWLTDQVSWADPGGSVRLAAEAEMAGGFKIDISKLPKMPASQLRSLLVPHYLREVPEVDGWGFAYQYRMSTALFDSRFHYLIRSPGSDGEFTADRYPEAGLRAGLYPPPQAHRDIVWADGRFVQAPRLIRRGGPAGA